MATLVSSGFRKLALPLAAMIVLAQAALAEAPNLPISVPVPDLNPKSAEQQVAPSSVPLPEPRPSGTPGNDQPAGSGRKQDASPATPDAAPKPADKPAKIEAEPPETAPTPPAKPGEKAKPGEEEKKVLSDPRSASLPEETMPETELSCRRRLKSMGVDFEEHKAEHDAEIGCSVPYPIVLKALGKSIDISPGAELNCEMAEAAARFAANVIQPAAKAEFNADLKSVSQASAFVCRPRHNGEKLSEHAFGNALDIATFTLSDGTRIEIGPSPSDKDGKFLNAVRKAACGPFKTVLGPGSDADHSLHFHLDLEPRRHGGTFCQ
jgi:hypothetical protein